MSQETTVTVEAVESHPIPFIPWGCAGAPVVLVAGERYTWTMETDPVVTRAGIARSIAKCGLIRLVEEPTG